MNDDLEMIVRDVPWPSKMVALIDEDGTTHTSFIVHQTFWSRTLKIFLFRGDPRQPWKRWAAERYPAARRVIVDRMRADGLHARPPIRLRPRTYWQACAAHLRAFFGVRP